MNEILLASVVAESEHAEQLMLWGIPTYWFPIVAGIIFLAMFVIAASFSGRGIVRPEHGAAEISHEEAQEMARYQAKHGR